MDVVALCLRPDRSRYCSRVPPPFPTKRLAGPRFDGQVGAEAGAS
jgi:hypothetical protein